MTSSHLLLPTLMKKRKERTAVRARKPPVPGPELLLLKTMKAKVLETMLATRMAMTMKRRTEMTMLTKTMTKTMRRKKL